MSAVKLDDFSICANGVDYGGLSFLFGSPLVRLLPEEFGEPALSVGERVTIELVNNDEDR
jgi:hypothetical protein